MDCFSGIRVLLKWQLPYKQNQWFEKLMLELISIWAHCPDISADESVVKASMRQCFLQKNVCATIKFKFTSKIFELNDIN